MIFFACMQCKYSAFKDAAVFVFIHIEIAYFDGNNAICDPGLCKMMYSLIKMTFVLLIIFRVENMIDFVIEF